MANIVKNREGLTLLELVVVLVILVALAGILIPLLPGMISRAHTAEHGTNCVETTKAVEMFNIINRGYPDQLDSLMGSSGSSLSTKLPPIGGTPCGGDLTTNTLTTITAAALNNANITTAWNLNDSSSTTDLLDPTTCYSGTATVASGSTVAMLSPAAISRLYNDPPANAPTGYVPGTYVVFGLGTKATMIGKPGGMFDAPLHFSDDPAAAGDPTKTYGRYALVFVIPGNATTNTVAQFVGALALHPDALMGADAAVEEFHQQNPQ